MTVDALVKRERPPNARFWVYVGGPNGWVKFTLRPGEKVRWVHGGTDEEGYWCERNRIRYECDEGEAPKLVWKEWYDGRDCDGRYEREQVDACRVELLAAREVECAETGETYYVPAWEELESRQRDHTAEAMGY